MAHFTVKIPNNFFHSNLVSIIKLYENYLKGIKFIAYNDKTNFVK